MVAETSWFEGAAESYAPDTDPCTESLPFTPMSADMGSVGAEAIETVEEGAHPSRSLPRAGGHIRSLGSAPGDTCTATWVNFLQGTPS
eukprot:3914546-Amphidinium_carterae.1